MERWQEEKKAQRQARQTWTATGKTRKETAPVHAPLKPLKPIANLGQFPGMATTATAKNLGPAAVRGTPQRSSKLSMLQPPGPVKAPRDALDGFDLKRPVALCALK